MGYRWNRAVQKKRLEDQLPVAPVGRMILARLLLFAVLASVSVQQEVAEERLLGVLLACGLLCRWICDARRVMDASSCLYDFWHAAASTMPASPVPSQP